MDRIEPVEDPDAGPSAQSQFLSPFSEHSSQSAQSPQRPPLATPQPRRNSSSNRARRPSIRISRLSSVSSLETVTSQPQQPEQQQQPGPSLSRRPSVQSPVAEEDEYLYGGRRRSSSEPRPGRWSSPPSDVLSRVTTPIRMMPLSEESSHQSPMQLTPREDQYEQHAPENLQVPAPVLERPGSRNVLRRTSQAALNRFSRNRASTVSGAPSTLASQDQQRRSEYAPQVVDVLDVIGKLLHLDETVPRRIH